MRNLTISLLAITVLLVVSLPAFSTSTALTFEAVPQEELNPQQFENRGETKIFLPLVTRRASSLLIPLSRLPTWDPGVRGGIPDVPVRVNVRDFGAAGDGQTDDTAAFKSAISACPKPGAVYLPAGSYVIRGRIDVPSGIVLRGDGIENTRILATPISGRHTFVVMGNRGVPVRLMRTAPKGSQQIAVANTQPFAVGQTVELEMNNESFIIKTYSNVARGQIARIVAISDNILTLDVPLRLDYPIETNPRVYPLNPAQNVGFENFYIKHVQSDGDQSTMFFFRFAVNSWIKNVESELCAKYHVQIKNSRHITVRDSVIHHSYNYGGGGQGYGIMLDEHACDCLITNNTLYMLRHSLLTNVGTNGNVISYNFSADDHSRQDQIGLADANLHGGYTYMDLFEGNVAQWFKIGGYWGQQGPLNTLFRNRMIKEPFSNPSNLYRAGVEIDHPSHDQNIMGNTLFGHIENTGKDGLALGLWIEKNLICRGGVEGDVQQSTVLENISNCYQVAQWSLPYSLYLPGKPDFWGDLPWPAIGADVDSQRMAAGLAPYKIPAQTRYEQIMGVVPPEPEPGEVIVDDKDPRFSTSYLQDDWQEYVRAGGTHYGDSHRYNAQIGTGQDMATWTFNVPEPGNYDVYAWWCEGDWRPTDVPYTINHSAGSETVRVDQRVNGDRWNLLGTFYFESEGSVVVSDDVSSGRDIVADAIRLVKNTQ